MSQRPREFIHSGGFHFRTPLLPFDVFLALGDGDPAIERQRLGAIVSSREFRDALFVASPDLDQAFDTWIADPESERGQRVERALVKYLSRAAGRATPFGLFAGTSVGRIGDGTDLVLDASARSVRHSRLDMDYLFALAGALTMDPVRRLGFTWKPNSSLYETAGHLRYVESRLAGEERTYHLVAVESSDALSATLSRAAGGATAADLAAALVDSEISRADADEFIGDLVDSQILVPDIGLVVTGDEPTGALAARLAACATTHDVAAALMTADAALAAIDAGGLGAAPARYRAIATELGALPAKPEIKRLFQVDLVKRSPDARLGGAVLDELARAVDVVRRLVPQTLPSHLAAFKDAFRERYETREVRLVDALDDESGIGFPAYGSEGSDGAPLIQGLPPLPDDPATAVWGTRERWLLDAHSRAVASGAQEIRLGDRDVDALAHPSPPPLPDAFALTARVAAGTRDAFTTGDFRVRIGALVGASGASFLGRFCHADPVVCRLVEDHLRGEEALQPDASFAEIVHLPEGRTGNILLRPCVREYEIEFLGESGAPVDRRLPITDLLVSLQDDTLIIRSTRLNRRIVPRLTAAHNYSLRSLGLYQFLCALQSDGRTSRAAWSWGPIDRAPFLPRVTHGRLVLSPAIWNLGTDELKRLGEKTAAARFDAVQALRRARALPRFVVLADYDNELPVDLDAALSVESFVHLVKGREQARIEELFPGPGELCARGPEGRFVHEIVVPFVRVAAPAPETVTSRFSRTFRGALPAVGRSFPPDSEWLYAKLYTGVVAADRVLLDAIAPLAEAAVATGAADRWFFIRYADPREHLRVRFHGDPARLREDVLPTLLAIGSSQLAAGRVWKVQLDTYEREVERYGGPAGIELAERLFCADSDAAVEILRLLDPGDEGNDERWRIVLIGLDTLLSDFGFDLGHKQEVVRRARQAYGVEQREDTALRHALGDRHRTFGREVASLLAVRPDDDHPLAPGVAVLRRRSERLAPIVAELRGRERDGRLFPGLAESAGSFMHMHAIRMLRTAAKRHEIVIYELLLRSYLERERRSGSQ